MLSPGRQIPLAIEKAAAGGRMIARFEGQIVLVAGAIPGERVIARVERVDRRLALATVERVDEASQDRREPLADPLCGGCVYSHIAYPRQLELKSDVLRDAYQRIGRLPLDMPIEVAASPEKAYRMRARLHVAAGEVGFYREGTHALCDAAPTGQLSDAALASVRSIVTALDHLGGRTISVELSENIAGDQRSLAIEVAGSPELAPRLAALATEARLTGCIVRDESGRRLVAGEPVVADPLASLTDDQSLVGVLGRHPESFFQGNRYLLPSLVRNVLAAVPERGAVIDLYAGVGLFSVPLSASGHREVTAVEGDRAGGADLRRNAGPYADALTVVTDSVERYLSRRSRRSTTGVTVVIDPPRTGLSAEAATGLLQLGAARVVYVSCDPATMARDARRLIDGGYRLESLRGFDLFPNTPHVEALGVFVR